MAVDILREALCHLVDSQPNDNGWPCAALTKDGQKIVDLISKQLEEVLK